MDASDLKSSSFLKEMRSLPLLQPAGDLYNSTRNSSRVLNTGLAVVEFTLSNVWGSMFSKTELASRIDGLAGDSVSKLREKYPALNKTPSELTEGTSDSLKKTVRGIMKTTPGMAFVRSLDWAIDMGEALLDRMTPRQSSPRKRKVLRSTVRKAQVAKDHAYASEDSGACEAEGIRTKHVELAVEPSNRQLMEHIGIFDKMYRLTMVLPLHICVQSMKSFRRYAAGKRKRQGLSPQKESEIDSRRKISPRKKVQSSFLNMIKSRTYKLLGYSSGVAIDLSRVSACKSPDRLDAEKKRKHDEILSDEASDSDEDIVEFDYDNYESEEDPDYEPDSSEDSEDTDIDDIEDDLNVEAECQDCTDTDVKHVNHNTLVQLKEKTDSAKLITNASKPAAIDDGISLAPQWKTNAH